jgi:hypothetical protein
MFFFGKIPHSPTFFTGKKTRRVSLGIKKSSTGFFCNNSSPYSSGSSQSTIFFVKNNFIELFLAPRKAQRVFFFCNPSFSFSLSSCFIVLYLLLVYSPLSKNYAHQPSLGAKRSSTSFFLQFFLTHTPSLHKTNLMNFF